VRGPRAIRARLLPVPHLPHPPADNLGEVEILSWPQADVPGPVRLQVSHLLDQMEPPGHRAGAGPHHDPALQPRCLALLDDGRVLATLYILSRELDHGGRRYAASGLSTVVTDRAQRRRGYGRRLIVAAREAMRPAGADLAIFTCDPPLAPFYESGGYTVLPGTVLVGGVPDDPLPSDRYDKVTLWHPFTGRAVANAADFRGARVELYPGTIDRLW
jgi:aminoglycoside 2'-N-acetyltransferase I